jgi:hypothetical protein
MTGITKSFFNCKSSSRPVNYEFVSYQRQEQQILQQDDTLMEFSNLPSSTMIESKDNFESTTLSYHLMPSYSSSSTTSSMQSLDQMSTIERQHQLRPAPSFISIPTFDRTEISESDHLIDPENTRHRRASLISVSTFKSESNCETVIHHNNHSPFSEYKSNYNLNDSNTILYECLHSTKISSSTKNVSQGCDQCTKCHITKAQETTLSPFSNKSNPNLDSPLLSSSTVSTSPLSSNPPSFQFDDSMTSATAMQPFESMISYLSSTVNDENSNATHICTSNYEATFVDDVTVKFADMVKVLRSDNNDEWIQVQVASDGRKGFVPRNIVLDIKQFISQLKQTTNNSSLSTIN